MRVSGVYQGRLPRLVFLALMAQHVGPVYVSADVLEEVEQLDVAQCLAIGLQVVEGILL